MNFIFKNIGISGVAGSGKNTLAEIISKFLKRMEIPCQELSVAKNLKKELSQVSEELYGIDPCNCTREEKDVIRPILVAHGSVRRKLSNGKHWTRLLSKELDKNKVNIITDIRYDEYEEDELHWLKNKSNGVLIHLSRYTMSENKRIYIPPANESEKLNDPKMLKGADFSINWNTEMDTAKRIASTEKLLKWIKRLYV